jgi:2-hydroxy-6-oxonona-2,4-dienedioate hydrolase
MLRPGRYHAMVDRIGAPTLLIHGRGDRLVPLAGSQGLVRRKPDWTLDVFDDMGHVPQLEAPGRFVESVVRWLRSRSRPA